MDIPSACQGPPAWLPGTADTQSRRTLAGSPASTQTCSRCTCAQAGEKRAGEHAHISSQSVDHGIRLQGCSMQAKEQTRRTNPGTHHLDRGKLPVMASQLRCTSKSVERYPGARASLMPVTISTMASRAFTGPGAMPRVDQLIKNSKGQMCLHTKNPPASFSNTGTPPGATQHSCLKAAVEIQIAAARAQQAQHALTCMATAQ